MIRTQIQLPDELYRQLKRLAAAKEWTLAETLRRASEYLLQLYSPDRMAGDGSALPAPLALGAFLSEAADWREMANLGGAGEKL